MKLNFADLVSEAQEKQGYETMTIDLNDGGEPIVLRSVPMRLFTENIKFAENDSELILSGLDLLRRMFPAAEWARVKSALEDAPVAASGQLLDMIFDHFGLRFAESEEGKDSDDPSEDSEG